jgi:hypothetical protein
MEDVVPAPRGVWEDALADGLVRIDRGCVLLTAAGTEILAFPAVDG